MKHRALLIANTLLACVLVPSTSVAQDAPERRLATPVPDLPGTQSHCDNGTVITSSTTFSNLPGTVATIDNGGSSRNVVITFSAEAGTDAGETLEVRFRIDGTIQSAVGPQFFASDEPGLDAHTIVSVFHLGSGVHTIRPVFRSFFGTGVSIGQRCLVLEGRTS